MIFSYDKLLQIELLNYEVHKLLRFLISVAKLSSRLLAPAYITFPWPLLQQRLIRLFHIQGTKITFSPKKLTITGKKLLLRLRGFAFYAFKSLLLWMDYWFCPLFSLLLLVIDLYMLFININPTSHCYKCISNTFLTLYLSF